MADPPAFDPSQPFETAPSGPPPFDPSKPFETSGDHGMHAEGMRSLNEALESTAQHYREAGIKPEDASAAWYDIRPELRRFSETGKAAASALGVPFAYPIGAATSLLGRGEAAAIKGVGENVVNPIGERVVPGFQSQHPTTSQIYEDIRPQVETAVGLAGVRRPVPSPVPPRPTSGPFGVTLSEGQTTRDLATIQREQAALRGTSGAPAQRAAQEFAEQQTAQLGTAREDITRSLDTLGNQIIAEGPQEAGQIVSQGIQRERARVRADVDAAYAAARAEPGEIHAGVFENMSSGIKGDLSLRPEPVIIDDRLTPYASRMIGDIEDRVSQLRIQNRADPFGQPNPQNIVGVNLAGVDQMRKRLSSMRRDAYASGNAADGRAAQAVIDAFDDRIDRAVNGGMFNGDPRAVQAWNDARAAYADYRQTFTAGKNDPIGRVVERITGRGNNPAAIPNDVADFLYGASGTNPSSLNVGVVQRVRAVLGEQSSEWAGVKQGLFSRLTETPQGVRDWGPGRIADRLNRFLNGDGRELSQVVFSPQERVTLQRYADLMRQLEVPQAGANWSNTATFLQRIGNRIGSNIAGALGSIAGHFTGVPYVGELAGYGLGNAAARGAARIGEAREARAISELMPTVANQMRQWQQAVRRAQSNATPSTRAAVTIASTNLARSLKQMGITSVQSPIASHAEENQNSVPRPPSEHHDGGKVENQPRAHGGKVGSDWADRNRKKLSHESVGYVNPSPKKNERCGKCSMFVPIKEGGPCTLVKSPIYSSAWCRRYDPKG